MPTDSDLLSLLFHAVGFAISNRDQWIRVGTTANDPSSIWHGLTSLSETHGLNLSLMKHSGLVYVCKVSTGPEDMPGPTCIYIPPNTPKAA